MHRKGYGSALNKAIFGMLLLFALCSSPVRAAENPASEKPADPQQKSAQNENHDQAAAAKQPRIVFTKTVHDFGETAQNSRLKHTFTFKNSGSAELDIQKVKSG